MKHTHALYFIYLLALENVIGLIHWNALASNPMTRLFIGRRATDAFLWTSRGIFVARAHVFIQRRQEQTVDIRNGPFVAPIRHERIVFAMMQGKLLDIFCLDDKVGFVLRNALTLNRIVSLVGGNSTFDAFIGARGRIAFTSASVPIKVWIHQTLQVWIYGGIAPTGNHAIGMTGMATFFYLCCLHVGNLHLLLGEILLCTRHNQQEDNEDGKDHDCRQGCGLRID